MQLIFAIFAFLTDAELSISKTVTTKSIFRDFFFFLIYFHLILQYSIQLTNIPTPKIFIYI